MTVKSERRKSVHYILTEFTAGSPVLASRYNDFLLFKHTDVECAFKLVRLFLSADMRQKHYGSSEHRAGVGILRSALFDHSRRGTVNSLEHSVFLTDICASRCADSALEFDCLVGDYVTVKVGKYKYFKVTASLRVDKLCRGDVYIPLVGDNIGVLISDFFAEI